MHRGSLKLDRHQPPQMSQAHPRTARDEPGASASEESQEVERRRVIHGVSISALSVIENRLAIQKLSTG